MTAHVPRPPHRARRRVITLAVWAMWLTSVVFLVISLMTARADGPDDPLEAVGISLAAVSFATAGAILVSRLPGNLIGWLLAAGGFCFAGGSGATGLADYGLTVHPDRLPGAIWFAWLSQWIWAPFIGSVVLLALVYPSGRLLSARWRPVALAAVLIIALLTFGGAFGAWPTGMFPVQNPLQIVGAAPGSMDVVNLLSGLIVVLVALGAVASLVVRYRRSAGIERAQLKWFALVMVISLPAFVVTAALYGDTGPALVVSTAAGLVAVGGFVLLPVAIGIAVLRYRLFEIDRLISRTISWVILTVLVAALFLAFVLVLQAIVAPLTGSNEIAVAGSTLLVFGLFAPIRRQVQRLVDRRFNRTRYDAERTVAAFAARLRDQVDVEALRFEILATVAATVEPSSVSLWLRE